MNTIELSKNGRKNRGKFKAIIDCLDSDLAKFNWAVATKPKSQTQYAFRSITDASGKRKRIFLHGKIAERFLGEKPKGLHVDHINRNGLDNRRENLRYVTVSANTFNSGISSRNRSGFKGVSWNSATKKWKSSLWKNNKEFFLGYYKNKADAAQSRKIAEKRIGAA